MNNSNCRVTRGPLIAGVSSATVVLSRTGTCTLVVQQPGNQIFNPAVMEINSMKKTVLLVLNLFLMISILSSPSRRGFFFSGPTGRRFSAAGA
jgi:hypothetical protein